MGKINVVRVIMGGLLAGLIVNISESILNLVAVAQPMADAFKRMNLPEMGGSTIAGFMVMGFVLGIVTIWLYAAIRPRFGANAQTAAIAGLAVWFFGYLYPGVGMAMVGMFSAKLTTITLVWGLAEIVIGSIAGAWVYSE